MQSASSPSTPRVAAPPAEGAEAWLLVSDGVLRGLNHALSNRIATVGAVVGILEPGSGDETEMLQTLAGEIRRLEEVLQLMRMVPRNPRAAVDPVRTSELCPEVILAHDHHPELRDIPCALTCDPEVQPVLVRETALAHAVLALLTAAKQAVLDAGAGEVAVRCLGDARRVVVRVEARRGAPLPGLEYRLGPATPTVGRETAMAAARWSLAGWPFALEERPAAADVLAAWELTLPSMEETRRREAAERTEQAPGQASQAAS